MPKVTSRLAPSFLPRTAVLELTYGCNHQCLFCSCPWFDARGGFEVRPELTPAAWREVVARLCTLGITEVCFTGGEPLLKDGLLDLIRYAAGLTAEHVRTEDGGLVVEQKPPNLHLLSNGLVMNEQVLRACAEHSVRLGMSLPGLTTFREHTRKGDPGGVLRWFRRAAELGVKTHVGITVTRKNLHELEQAVTEALRAGAGEVLLNRFMPGGRGVAHAQELMLSRDEIAQMLETAERVLRSAGRWGNVGTELPRCLFDESRFTRLKIGSNCAAASDFFVIDPSGWLRVCNHSPERLAPFSELDRVKDHPTWRRFVTRDYLAAECAGCALAARCAGGCREAARIWNGRIDALDPLFDAAPPRPVGKPRTLS